MKLICATDFSSVSEVAMNLAASLAGRLGDELEIVHVAETPATIPEFAVAGPALVADLQHEAARKLIFLTDRLRAQGLAASWKALSGFAEEALIDHARQQPTRALVVGSHGRRGAARVFLGGLAERLIRSSTVPLLVVPGSRRSAAMGSLPADRPLRVVAGVDRSRASDAVLGWLRAFRAATSSEVTLIHAYWPLREHVRFGVDEDLEHALEGDEQVAELLERELRPHIQALLGEPAVLHLRPNLGRDADPLAREGERAGADLLLVGTNHHGRRGGSTAVATVRAAGCPVLCVPAESAPAVPEEERRRPLRTLLVPVDLSPNSAESVALACRLLQGSGGIIELLNVVEPSAEGLSSSRGAELERRLYALVPGWQQHGIMARPSVVESDSVARAILQAAERLAVDAVVLAAHEHPGLLRAITGAVVAQVMRSCSRPVVVVPSAALAA